MTELFSAAAPAANQSNFNGQGNHFRPDRVTGKRVGIVGMARSGLACARLLANQGAAVFLSDTKSAGQLQTEISQLQKWGLEYEAGGHTRKLVTDRDFLVLSPGVPPDVPICRAAEAQGIPVFSEIEVASWLCPAAIVGITGSNGKTTTTSLAGEMFRNAGYHTLVAGNIGTAFSSVVEQATKASVVVLEISSFQLEKIEEFRPRTAVLLNLSPDHLDRYGNYEAYKQAKLRIFENQKETDFAVLNADDLGLSDLPPKLAAKVAFFSTKGEVGFGACIRQGEICLKRNGHYDTVLPAAKVGIPGPHNLSNATAACAIGLSFGLAPEVMARALAEFKGVEHRLEFVAEIDGVKFINDSKATNVDAVWYALQSVPQPIVLIAGGKDKGGSYAPLREFVAQRVKKLILIGQAKEKIKEALGDVVTTVTAESLPEAVEVGFSSAAPGDTVLLSPACASFDMFTNFEERGRIFKQTVAGLKGRTGGGDQ